MRQSLGHFSRSLANIEKHFAKVWCKQLLRKLSYFILNLDQNWKNSKLNNF